MEEPQRRQACREGPVGGEGSAVDELEGGLEGEEGNVGDDDLEDFWCVGEIAQRRQASHLRFGAAAFGRAA